MEICNVYLLQYLTIASVFMTIYKNKFMPEKSIAVVKQDYKNILENIYVAKKEVFIQHAMNLSKKILIVKKKMDLIKKTQFISFTDVSGMVVQIFINNNCF